jgi:hypothetical protein
VLLQGAAYVDGENSALLKQRLAEHDRRQEDTERTDDGEDDDMDLQADENGLYGRMQRVQAGLTSHEMQEPSAIG